MHGDRGRWWVWLVAVPPLVVAALVSLLGSDVPYTDAWDLLAILLEAKAGTLTFADYWAYHGPHRFVLPKIILTHVALATEWNVRVQLLVNVAIACMTLAAVGAIAARQRAAPGLGLALVGSSLAIFSLSQHDNWLWGWHIGYVLTIALVVGAVAVLVQRGWPFPARVAIAAILCILATFSIGFGAASWLALAPLVALEAPSRHRALAVWTAVMLGTIALYPLGGLPTLHSIPGEGGPADIALFFITLAGSQWTSDAAAALPLGAVSLALFAFVAVRAARLELRAAMPWIGIALFALGFAAMTTLARARLGWSLAESTRYATPMLLLTVATLHLARFLDVPRARRAIPAVLVGLLVFADLAFLPVFRDVAAVRRVNRICNDLFFLVPQERAACIPASHLHPRLEAQLVRARELGIRPFADATWFSGGTVDAPSPPRVVRTAGGLTIAGTTERSLLPQPILVTGGTQREPVTLVWPEEDGSWRVRIRGAAPAAPLEIWTVPGHEKRLIRIGG
ncbi:MAG: hypothetical protein ACRD2J_16245 [Thermoanaerobaculia bacterium]